MNECEIASRPHVLFATIRTWCESTLGLGKMFHSHIYKYIHAYIIIKFYK
jgi:hypothetical protein